MLRFNFHEKNQKKIWTSISIHPMLRFNGLQNRKRPHQPRISIHPMLRFNILRNTLIELIIKNFNTSYVTVQQIAWKIPNKKLKKFQYILCYGSTIFFGGIFLWKKNFNTSYVTVQLFLVIRVGTKLAISIHPMLRFNFVRIILLILLSNFNTSYVTVQQNLQIIIQFLLGNFNTSYVTVQLIKIHSSAFIYTSISIHPMLRFNYMSMPEICME